MRDKEKSGTPDAVSPRPVEEGPSLYTRRGTPHVGSDGPNTCLTMTIETVDDDRASSLLGVLPPG